MKKIGLIIDKYKKSKKGNKILLPKKRSHLSLNRSNHSFGTFRELSPACASAYAKKRGVIYAHNGDKNNNSLNLKYTSTNNRRIE
jgi:hypothetical protein